MAAGLVQSFIITPVDLLKIRQQLQTVLPGSPAYVGPLSLLQQVLRAEGIQGKPLNLESKTVLCCLALG